MKKTSPIILIVEDEPLLSEAYQTILKSANYTVRSATDGQSALDSVEQQEPDLILLDLRMAPMSGIDFLREYHVRERHPHVKIIVFSNYDMQKDIDEAYRYGADRYILKAWAAPKDLLRVVSDTLASA